MTAEHGSMYAIIGPQYIAEMQLGDLHVSSTHYPNRFWRTMQYLVLGIKWRKHEA